MSLQDPIADFLTRIRNAQSAQKKIVTMPSSRPKVALAMVLKEEGYIIDYQFDQIDKKPILAITLKYYQGKGVIARIKRVSRPGLRVYKSWKKLPKVLDGLGIAIVSTSKGIMTDQTARRSHVGGEVLCFVE